MLANAPARDHGRDYPGHFSVSACTGMYGGRLRCQVLRCYRCIHVLSTNVWFPVPLAGSSSRRSDGEWDELRPFLICLEAVALAPSGSFLARLDPPATHTRFAAFEPSPRTLARLPQRRQKARLIELLENRVGLG